MDPIAITVGLILLGTATIFVLRPFRAKPVTKHTKVAGTPTPRGARTAALAALRDLDFDYRTGKVSEEDYSGLRAELLVEAAKYVDTLGEEDERLEAMIRARKSAIAHKKPCPKCGKSLADDAQFCPHCGAQPGLACPSCGKPVKAGDLFCRLCGSKLELGAEVAV